jgi:hypothetical protein
MTDRRLKTLKQVFGLEGGCKAHPSSEDERNLRFIIVTFGVGFTVCVVFGQRLFTSVVSLMTAVKGAWLVRNRKGPVHAQDANSPVQPPQAACWC